MSKSGNQPTGSSVAIVGGGIVGRSIALALARRGTAVSIVDPAHDLSAASWGNAGHIATEQVARLFDVPHVRLVRYEPDGSVVVGGFSDCDHGPFPIGSRLPLDSAGVIAAVRQTGRAARTVSRWIAIVSATSTA